LFQRSKGRDLFDLWLAVRHAGAAREDIAACFEPYRPNGWRADRALENPDAKLGDSRFVCNLDALIGERPDGYTVHDTTQVARKVVSTIPQPETVPR
jgi:hypothetical protein